ncbi:MAG: aminopeptidase [Chloroflexi bacterium]|nr:aminopeptidase [Chloroflexota bacterium]
MATEAKLRQHAELIVDTCFTVEQGDVVTIITDDQHAAMAAVVADVAAERGASPVIMNNEAQVARALKDTSFPMAPPKNLHDAMLAADEIIIMTNLEWANRFAHVSAVKESCANNVKIASVEGGMGEWDIGVEDILASTDRAVAAIGKLDGVKQCRVWTPEGTDVTVSIEDRPALQVTPIRQRGWMMGPLPLWAEVAYAAVENKTNGVIAVTGNMLGIGVDVVSEPIFWHVKDGKCVGIEGGRDAKELQRVIEGVPNVEIVAEFAFGTSDKSPLGSPSEKGRIGNVHFALGDNKNAYPGGQNSCRLHLDGVVRNATLEIMDTGGFIFRDGQWDV